MTNVSRAIRNFRAMGCRSTIVIEGAGCDRLAELAMIRIARLEACWSLFLPDSDVSRINRADGAADQRASGHADAPAGDGRSDGRHRGRL